MHALCIGNNCIAKDNFHLTLFEMDNKGILFIIIIYLFTIIILFTIIFISLNGKKDDDYFSAQLF